MLWPRFSLIWQQLLELQPYKVATTERLICTASIGKINYMRLQNGCNLQIQCSTELQLAPLCSP